MKERFFPARVEARKIIGANILIFLVFFLLRAMTGHVIAFIRPPYDALCLALDKELGWKQVPNLGWIWAGRYWYAADFSVEIQTNPFGFRDIARAFPKPRWAKRIVLLGNSTIEAAQVPFEKTAGQVLAQKLTGSLNQTPQDLQKGKALNSGTSIHKVVLCGST